MSNSDKKTDEDKFNETLKRMLETPPKPHKKQEGDSQSRRPPVSDQGCDDRGDAE